MVRNKFIENINIYYLKGLSEASLEKGMKRMMEESEQRDKIISYKNYFYIFSKNIFLRIREVITQRHEAAKTFLGVFEPSCLCG